MAILVAGGFGHLDIWPDCEDLDRQLWGIIEQRRLDGEEKESLRVVRGGWCSATEFVYTSTARRQLRADAGSRDDEGDGHEEDDGGLMVSLFSMMYTPYGFRVVCECP